jgi:hypothetical protein
VAVRGVFGGACGCDSVEGGYCISVCQLIRIRVQVVCKRRERRIVFVDIDLEQLAAHHAERERCEALASESL